MNNFINGRENDRRKSVLSSELDKTKDMPAIEPPPTERLNWLIHLQRVRGETGPCKELIKDGIARSGGKNEFVYFTQGAILREEGRIQEALDSFQTCMKLNPENSDNVKEVAKCLYEMRRFRLSLEAYLEAERVSKNPDWQIYYNIGRCLMRLGDVVKAKEYAQRAVQLGKHETAYALLVRILMGENDFKGAAAICNTAVEACPDSVAMLTELGLLYLKMGQMQHAFEKLSSALALDPTCTKALLGIGCITQSYEEHDVALTKYKMAVANDLNSVALWNNIGMCFQSKQKHVAAISCLKRALWISPLNWRVLFNLGLVHLTTYQPASAFNFLCAAVNLRPDVPPSFTLLGCALLELKDSENAARTFKQALSLKPDDPIALANTVLCLATMGAEEQAVEALNKLRVMQEEDVVIPQEVSALIHQLSFRLESSREAAARIEEAAPEPVTHEDPHERDVIEENNTTTEFAANDQSIRELLDPDEV